MIGDLGWWLEKYAAAFALPRPLNESGDPLATLTTEGAVRDVMRAIASPGVATRTYADRQIAIERVHLKPWGRIAFVEVAVSYVDRVTTAGQTYEERRQDRFRLAEPPQFVIADVYDPTARAWLVGDAPRYSALQLEAEVADAVRFVLVQETFVEGGDIHSYAGPGPETPLRRARKAERDALVAGFQKGAFLARRVEDVTARITRFDPATTLGEGVVAVSVAARIVTVGPDRTERSQNVTREYRFLRLASLATWQLIDDRRADGQWLSGGELALYDLDGRFG